MDNITPATLGFTVGFVTDVYVRNTQLPPWEERGLGEDEYRQAQRELAELSNDTCPRHRDHSAT